MSFLTLKNVRIKINDSVIIDGVNFNVEKGEIISIIGPNGAGKTMLVRAILGLQKYEGEIILQDGTIKNKLAKIGYVPQTLAWDRTFPITVLEFLNLSSNFTAKKIGNKICSELNLRILMNKKLGELSGGQMQRVLIAAALLKSPELLILDEPTSGVDAEGAKNFYELVEHLNKKHEATIILISHDTSMVYKLSTKVVCLNRDLFCFGAPNKVITPENLDKFYQNQLKSLPHQH